MFDISHDILKQRFNIEATCTKFGRSYCLGLRWQERVLTIAAPLPSKLSRSNRDQVYSVDRTVAESAKPDSGLCDYKTADD